MYILPQCVWTIVNDLSIASHCYSEIFHGIVGPIKMTVVQTQANYLSRRQQHKTSPGEIEIESTANLQLFCSIMNFVHSFQTLLFVHVTIDLREIQRKKSRHAEHSSLSSSPKQRILLPGTHFWQSLVRFLLRVQNHNTGYGCDRYRTTNDGHQWSLSLPLSRYLKIKYHNFHATFCHKE